jgi:hypothetical protein
MIALILPPNMPPFIQKPLIIRGFQRSVADSNYNFKSYIEKINISIQINVPLFDEGKQGRICSVFTAYLVAVIIWWDIVSRNEAMVFI